MMLRTMIKEMSRERQLHGNLLFAKFSLAMCKFLIIIMCYVSRSKPSLPTVQTEELYRHQLLWKCLSYFTANQMCLETSNPGAFRLLGLIFLSFTFCCLPPPTCRAHKMLRKAYFRRIYHWFICKKKSFKNQLSILATFRNKSDATCTKWSNLRKEKLNEIESITSFLCDIFGH